MNILVYMSVCLCVDHILALAAVPEPESHIHCWVRLDDPPDCTEKIQDAL